MESTDQKLREMKKILSTLQEHGRLYQDFAKTLEQYANETRTMKPLIGKPGETSLKDSWLVRAGLALIAFPDPTISDLVGSMLVTAGVIKHKTRKLTAADACCEFQSTVKTIHELAKDIRQK
ncbi:hypothetical protein KEJ18_01160 [Candidatus Bathyarchaeota archaeon]|nr:hypothetical protein [Candidatus Bathyarchaeota archaeon]